MCGFSSGSHFFTAFGALFGNTPRENNRGRTTISNADQDLFFKQK
jgi:AraC-like DNA-binding protein